MTRAGLSKQIRKFCAECMGGQPGFVPGCSSRTCLLVDYRLSPLRQPKKSELLSVISRYCLECVGGILEERRNCTDTECVFYLYRMGIDPHRSNKKGFAVNRQHIYRAKRKTLGVHE